MSSIKNLNIHRKSVDKALKRSKTNKLKLILVGALAVLVVGGSVAGIAAGVSAYNEHRDQQQIATIVEYYGETSEESKIIEYIGVSEQLNALKLSSYSIDDALFLKHNISNELMSPTDIEALISKLKTINSYISSKDITKQSENVELVLTLKMQEQLVNGYIYDVGYSVANNNVANATKKYAAEVFGINDYKDVTFKYSASVSDGEESIIIKNDDISKIGDEKSYNIDNWFMNNEEKRIKDGVIGMVDTDAAGDKNIEDNNKYNKERNINIKNALEKSVTLEKEVTNSDLYNDKMFGNMK